MTATDRKIAELEAALADRDREIANLQQQLIEAQPAPGMVRELHNGAADMPTPGELAVLYKIVATAYPTVANALDNGLAEFTAAFRYASACLSHTRDGEFSRYANFVWSDRASAWTNGRGLGRVGLAAIVLAVISLDATHTLTDGRWPHFNLAVMEGAGRPLAGGWRKTLTTKQPRAPTQVSRPDAYRVGDMGRLQSTC